MSTVATWAFLILLIGSVCGLVASAYLKAHLEDPEDDVDRLFELDVRRANARAVMNRPNRWAAR